MTPREALFEVIDRDDEVALALARVIRQYEGWNLSDTAARKRVRQCLQSDGIRNFDIDWALLVADVFVKFDVAEPVAQIIDIRRRDAEYALRNKSREMRVVRSRRRSDRRAG